MKRWDVQGYSFVTDIGQFVKHADYVQVETTLHNWIDKAGGYRCRIDQLESERDTLRAELAECKRDAERYRWIRGNVPSHSTRWSRWKVEYFYGASGWNDLRHAKLDAEIDAALAAKEE